MRRREWPDTAAGRPDAAIIDLCDSSPDSAPGANKRRRRSVETHAIPPRAVPTIELSDGEDSEEDARLARRLQEEERERADAEMARRLQEQEQQQPSVGFAAHLMGRGMPPLPRGAGFGGWAANMFGSEQMMRMFGDEPDLPLYRSGAAMLPPQLPGMPYRALGGGGGGGGRAGSRLAHLSMMDRDFGEADYEMLKSLDEDNGRERKRVNSKLVDQLPARRLSKAEAKEDRTCAICLESIRVQQSMITLPCKHEYHRQCITKWLKSSEVAACCICKAPALEPPPPQGGGRAGANDAGANDAGAAEQFHWHT